MRFEEKQLKKARLIYGFANQPIKVKWSITLLVTLGGGRTHYHENDEITNKWLGAIVRHIAFSREGPKFKP